MARQICLFSPSKDVYCCQKTETNDAHQAVEQLLKNRAGHDIVNALSKMPLRDVLSIHNPEGMRNLEQVKGMAARIVSGGEVLHENGLPNIKIIIAPNGKPLLFDGHHSALAYLKAGKTLLQEIPHVVFSADDFGAVTPKEIARFFHPQDKEKIEQDWFGWVVNWQAADEKLEQRTVETVGQLADVLGD